MTITAPKPLTANQQAVYDFFSPGCSFTRADLVRLTRMQGNTLTFPLMSLVKRGLIAEAQGDGTGDEVTYTMVAPPDPAFEAEKAAFMDDMETAYVLDDDEAKARLLREPASDTIALITVAPDGTEDALAADATADTVRTLTAARASGKTPKATGEAKTCRTSGAYRIEGRAKKSGAGTLYVGVWADTGETMRWRVEGGKNGAYSLRIQADDEATAIRWAARQFPDATMEDAR